MKYIYKKETTCGLVIYYKKNNIISILFSHATDLSSLFKGKDKAIVLQATSESLEMSRYI